MWQAGFLNLSYRARHQKWYTSNKQVSKAGIGLGHGATHSGTEFLEGFRRFSQEPQKDLFLNQSSSDSARAGFGAGAGRKVRNAAQHLAVGT